MAIDMAVHYESGELQEYAEGVLGEYPSSLIDAHLEWCAVCRSDLLGKYGVLLDDGFRHYAGSVLMRYKRGKYGPEVRKAILSHIQSCAQCSR